LSVSIGGVELIKRTQIGVVEEIRTVSAMRIVDHRRVIELNIPGSSGNVLQDMGSDSAKIIFTGEMTGKNSRDAIAKLREKYDKNKPTEFSSTIATLADISQVLVEELYIEQNAAHPNKYRYRMTLHEFVEHKK
jgi:hypothetical protein